VKFPVGLISDLHSNLEALTAVYRVLDEIGAEEVYCLGDIVGYGPQPGEVIDLVRSRCQVVLRGNHDDAVFNGADDFNPIAREALETNREMLRPGFLKAAVRKARWTYLENLPLTSEDGDFLFVHGSPRDPIREYVMKTDIVFAPKKMEEIFSQIPRYAFGGHTHQPGAFIEGIGHKTPEELGGRYEFGPEKAFINIGSVGQPRDGNPRSCFAVIFEDRVEWIRVPYDIAQVQDKIRRLKGIDNLCAERLELGR
jgi:diadenosine tetraphosphatase ApaH/serine/threonine PP2A family protein phosphatase